MTQLFHVSESWYTLLPLPGMLSPALSTCPFPPDASGFASPRKFLGLFKIIAFLHVAAEHCPSFRAGTRVRGKIYKSVQKSVQECTRVSVIKIEDI